MCDIGGVYKLDKTSRDSNTKNVTVSFKLVWKYSKLVAYMYEQ